MSEPGSEQVRHDGLETPVDFSLPSDVGAPTIATDFVMPDGPLRRNELAHWLGIPLAEAIHHLRIVQKSFPTLFEPDHDGALQCAPEVSRIIFERMNHVPVGRDAQPDGEQAGEGAAAGDKRSRERQARREREATEEFQAFADEVRGGETLDAQAFEKLVSVLGAESALDVLYRFRPDSRIVPMPLVRSFLSEYLGDVIIRPGTIDWDNMGQCLEYLDDSKLQMLLANVIKRSCLRHYNKAKKEDPNQDDFDILASRLDEISARFEDLEDANLNAVMSSVDNYYKEVFFFEPPANMVGSLKKGRTFPDLNQRVNVHEALTEKRFLFADAPGLGKSASAIMTKELSGSKLALVLAPSAIFNKGVWQQYLSSEVGPRGKQLGYFREGEEPRVLVINRVEDLQNVSADDYDYVVMSSDRLDREDYMTALRQLEFDMMIVDEAHTLKNIVEGKRSANLIELSTKLGPEDYLLMLSATPAPNKVQDIALTLRLMYPDKFRDHTNADLVQTIIQGDLLEIRSLLLPKMQCKSYEDSRIVDVAEEHLVFHELEGNHKLSYEVILDDWEMEPREKLQILRQILLNPGILDGTPDVDSVKIKHLHDQLDELFLTKKKAIVFFNGYTRDVIALNKDPQAPDIRIIDQLAVQGIRTEVIHGDVRIGPARDKILSDFQNSKDPMLLILSGGTVNYGIDLSAADAIFENNEPWTVADKDQQYGRGERPGRRGKLYKETEIFGGTIEEGIHRYILAKNVAINKLLHGVPLTEAEQAMVKTAERSDEEAFEVNAELAKFYYSPIDRMNRIFGMVKEIGEEQFRNFLGANEQRYAKEYAATYQQLTTRSYQANTSRLSATIIDRLEDERDTIKPNQPTVILDAGSGPEMLRRHAPEELAERVISHDINDEHFKDAKGPTIVGTLRDMKVDSGSVDYVNMSLAFHYTAWRPKMGNFERLEALAEVNRVLKVGGTGVITMPYSLNFRDKGALEDMLGRLGFAIVKRYSGQVNSGAHFQAEVLTIQKLRDVRINNLESFVMAHDPRVRSGLIESLRFRKNDSHLQDQRLIAQSFSFEGSQAVLGVQLNATDRAVLKEETEVLREMAALRAATTTASIVDIPPAEILKRGFSRIWNGKKYILFKHLKNGGGAVTYR